MRQGAYLMHVTIDTGHRRLSYRDEVDDAVVTIVAQQLAEARTSGDAEIRPGYRLRPVSAGASLLATVESERLGPLATIAVTGKSRDSAKLWGLLSASATAAEPPPVPWCAVKLYPAVNHDSDALIWLGDFERILAWAWLERPRNGDAG